MRLRDGMPGRLVLILGAWSELWVTLVSGLSFVFRWALEWGLEWGLEWEFGMGFGMGVWNGVEVVIEVHSGGIALKLKYSKERK